VEKCGCVAVSEDLDLYITRWPDTDSHSRTGLFMKPEGGTSRLEHREHDRSGWDSIMRGREDRDQFNIPSVKIFWPKPGPIDNESQL